MPPTRYVTRMFAPLLILLPILGACAPEDPKTAADCAMVLDPGPKQDCLVKVAMAMFKADPKSGEAFLDAELSDPLQRDMAYMRVGADVYPNEAAWCAKIKDDTFKETCKARQLRPHLQEHEGQGRVPPPGAQPPPGAPPAPPAPPPNTPPPTP